MSARSRKRRKLAIENDQRRRKWIYGTLAVVAVAALLTIYYAALQQDADQLAEGGGKAITGKDEVNAGGQQAAPSSDSIVGADPNRFPIPAIRPTGFRNTSHDVAYVGTKSCLECHLDEHQTYLETTHSRSFAEVDVESEPPDGEFYHELSGRHYRVYRNKGELHLCEFIKDDRGQEVMLADHTARYAFGSGNYARMYLVQVDDFFVESPMTWYPRQNRWGMSAGYEKDAHHAGFSREVGWGCLACHAGKVDEVEGADERLKFRELAISCERCHGPGELHVKERKANLPLKGEIDNSIVNLKHLSRERQEDVCAQCHLSASADVNVRGRRNGDFRPGANMSDFRVSYRVDRPEAAMTVSGQIEQMRLSRCYIESATMTCATCHNPHSQPKAAEKVEYYRQKCLSCHESQACGLAVEDRKAKQAQDNCVICHMPRGPTDIPHFSFTHHRVGIHLPNAKHEKLNASDKLVPVMDVSHLPEIEQQRMLGLANDAFAAKLAGGLDDETRDDPSYRKLAHVFSERAQKILLQVRSQGLLEPDTETFFSLLHWRRNPPLSIAHAEAALKLERITPASRKSALYNLATSHFDQGRFRQAFPYLEELVKIERDEISLMLLGICHQKQGNLPEAARLVKQAILDSPERADLHIYLASLYREMAKHREAEQHMQRAMLLRSKVPQPEQ